MNIESAPKTIRDPRLDFAWGNGNDFLLWNRHSKNPVSVKLPEEMNKQKILNRAILINWEECDDRESKAIRLFAQNLYQFHTQKLDILENIPDEKEQQETLLVKIKEANFAYCNALTKASEGYQKDNQPEKALEFLQYFLIWRLADIFYMRENSYSKTQEFSNWIRFFPDISTQKEEIEKNTQCDFYSLLFFLGLGDIDNVIAILKNITFESNNNDSIHFAVHETIEVLKRKIRYYKGDDCPYNDKQSFLEITNKERERYNRILVKWKSSLGDQHNLVKFLKVLTGDLNAIKEAADGDWKRFLNLVFLFHYPFLDKHILSPIINEFASEYSIFDADKTFLSIIINSRAFIFLQSINGQLPAWFTFHLSDLLYLFKQIPLEPILFNESDEDSPEYTFSDITLHDILGYIVQAKVPYDVIKYYVFYVFQSYSGDRENKLSEEYLDFLEQIYTQRMNSYTDEDIQNYLQELQNPIITDVEVIAGDLFINIRNNLIKRMARNYINAPLNQNNVRRALEIISDLQDAEFANDFGGLLIKEYEEGNEDIATVVIQFELEGNSVFSISDNLSFLARYSRFKRSLQEITVSSGAALEAKNLLTDMIIERNSPEDNRLLVLNYAIDLFESDCVRFTSDEIHAFIEQFSTIESVLSYQEVEEQNKYKKVVHCIKLCLMRALSRSIRNA